MTVLCKKKYKIFAIFQHKTHLTVKKKQQKQTAKTKRKEICK